MEDENDLVTSKAISQALSIVIVIGIILVGSAGYFGYFAGAIDRQTTTLTATSTFTTTPSPNVTITEVIVEDTIETSAVNACTIALSFTNSTTYVFPTTVTASQFYATVTTRTIQSTSTVTGSPAQVFTNVINGTTYTTLCA